MFKFVQNFVTFYTPGEFVSFHAKASNELLVIDLQKVFCVRFIARKAETIIHKKPTILTVQPIKQNSFNGGVLN